MESVQLLAAGTCCWNPQVATDLFTSLDMVVTKWHFKTMCFKWLLTVIGRCLTFAFELVLRFPFSSVTREEEGTGGKLGC